MMEALDPKHESELTQSLMAECERLLDAKAAADASPDADVAQPAR